MFSKAIIILYIVMTTHDMNIHSLNQQATIATYYKHSDHLSNRYSILLPNGQIPKYMSISFLSVQLLKQLSFFDALIKGLRIKAVVLPVLSARLPSLALRVSGCTQSKHLETSASHSLYLIQNQTDNCAFDDSYIRHGTLCYNVKMTDSLLNTSSGSSAMPEGFKSISFAFQPSQTPRRNSFTCPNHSWLHNW